VRARARAHAAPPPRPRALTRAPRHRLLEFVGAFLSVLVDDREPNLARAVRLSYARTLAAHHPWVVRVAVSALSPFLPSREKFFAILAPRAPGGAAAAAAGLNSAASRAPSTEDRLSSFAASVRAVRDRLTVFVCEHALDVE